MQARVFVWPHEGYTCTSTPLVGGKKQTKKSDGRCAVVRPQTLMVHMSPQAAKIVPYALKKTFFWPKRQMRVLSVSVGGRKSAQQKPLYLRPGKTINASHDKHGSFTLSQVLMPPQATKIVPYALKKLFLNKRQIKCACWLGVSVLAKVVVFVTWQNYQRVTRQARFDMAKLSTQSAIPGRGGKQGCFAMRVAVVKILTEN